LPTKIKKGITPEDFTGAQLIKVEKIKGSYGKDDQKRRVPIVIGRVVEEGHPLEDEETTHKWGVTGRDPNAIFEKILEEAWIEDDKVIFMLPEPDPESDINWINAYIDVV